MKDEEYSCLDRRRLCMPFDPMKDLDSYLNDHLAGSISALELIAHCIDVHKGEPLGSFFVETERLWVALAAAKLPGLNGYNFEQLQRRAEQQVERIEAERISAVRQAFTGATRSN